MKLRLLVVCLLLSAGARADEQLLVFPPEIELRGAQASQRFVVQHVSSDGLTTDLTATAGALVADATIATTAAGRVQPVGDGETSLVVQHGDLQASVPVRVRDAGAARPPNFRLDVMPALTRAGCNSGTCHGSARGQDGFHLSLFGYDPDGDYRALTTELPGRRINLGRPDESLLLTKGLGMVPHTGGQRLTPDDELHRALLAWLELAAPPAPTDTPEVVAVDVFPPELVLIGSGVAAAEGAGTPHGVVVRARYSDGSSRDVTSLAALLSTNETSLRIGPDGRAWPGVRGEALVLARFGPLTAAIPAIVLPPESAPPPPGPPARNYVDELVDRKLARLRIQPSEVCSDAVFLRRVHLDIVGLLPDVETCQRFLADERPDKRARMIDELLQRKEFVELWVLKWAERLQVRSTNEYSYKSMLLYYQWLQKQIADGVPLNTMVRELLTASGGAFSNPAVSFYEIEREPLKLAENVAQVFLGMRIQCAQCHNHPFDRWTMDDYYGFAAFFPQIGRKAGEDPREAVIFNTASGETQHPVGGAAVPPKFLGGPRPDLAGRDRRAVLAEWLTDPHNPWFARSAANFVWAHFFGHGIVEPVDDFRISNPPSNAALLDALAARLVETDFDMRSLVRDICNSRTYQLATRAEASNAHDTRNYARAEVRRIRAEVLLDIISQVTATRDKFRGLPAGARAVQIADGSTSTYFLATFGRARRETVCTCEVVMEPSLSQALHLINGETVQRKISESGRVAGLLAEGRKPTEVLDYLYQACLTRMPTEAERTSLLAELDSETDARVVLDDLFWSLLNSKEFLFNH